MSSSTPRKDGDRSGLPVRRMCGARFPRNFRLLRHADFERVYQHGSRHFSTHMTVFYLLRQRGEGLRVGFTVGRALGVAVTRNRIRRRLREAVRQCWPASPVPADMVINPKKSALQADFSGLLAEVDRAFQVIQQKLAERSHS